MLNTTQPARWFFFACIAATLAIHDAAIGCPFCGGPTLTLSEQLKAAQSAVVADWASGERSSVDGETPAWSDFRIRRVIQDETDIFTRGQIVRLTTFVPGQRGERYLLFGTVEKGVIQWGSPQRISNEGIDYLLQAPDLELPTARRLRYFLEFLEDPDSFIAMDAFGEFGNSPYEDVAALADHMPRDKLRKWLTDPDVTPTRLGLYGMMLGLCGTAEDALFLKELILRRGEEDFRLGLDGMMGGFLLLSGEEALEVIEERFLSHPDVPIDEAFAAIQALRFMWSHGRDRISGGRLKKGMRRLLDRPDVMELVVIDLARWQDWEVMNRIVSCYNREGYEEASIKKVIVRYLMIAEKDAVPAAADDDVPDHAAQARRHLAEIRRTDPAIVKTVERYFFD